MLKSASSTTMLKNLKEGTGQKDASPTPGPGDYIKTDRQLNMTSKTNNQGSMPRSKRFNQTCLRGVIGKFSPGPVYLAKNLELDSTKQAKPKVNFPKQIRWDKRNTERQSKLPSPASYILPHPKPRHISPFKLSTSSSRLLDIL